MDVLIVGAGALGSYIGHLLSRTCDVTLVARGEHASAIRKSGLKVKEGGRQLVSRPRVSPRPVKGKWDMVLVTTKAYDTERALSSALDVLGDRTALVLFQNGLGLEDLAVSMMEKRGLENPVARGLTSHGFDLTGPGVVRHTGQGRTLVGDYHKRANIGRLARALEAGGMEAKLVKNIRKEAWTKAVVNASINPVAAVAGVPNGRLLGDSGLREVMREACYEAAHVAEEEVNVSRRMLWNRTKEVAQMTSGNRNSMLQDLDRGRPTEIDFINGEIVRRADIYGIPVPVNRTLIAMIKAKQHL